MRLPAPRRMAPSAHVSLALALLLCGVLAACGGGGLDKAATQIVAKVNKEELTVHQVNALLAQQEKYLDRLRHDPALVEMLIRQKLGYAKGEEFVFRFEEEKK